MGLQDTVYDLAADIQDEMSEDAVALYDEVVEHLWKYEASATYWRAQYEQLAAALRLVNTVSTSAK